MFDHIIWSQNTTLHSTSWAVSGIGICGCHFNVYVILRIICQGLKSSHFSKIYYLSLAIADLAVGGSSVIFTFILHGVIKFPKRTWFWYVANGIAWVSFTSSLLHVVTITADRFLATMFPLHYRTGMTHKRVTIAIVCIWLISIILVISMTWHYNIAFWCGVLGIPIGSLGIIVTYTCIIMISVKRKRMLRVGLDNCDAPVAPDDVINSINTICLGLSITLTYIVCNLPLSIALMLFLRDKKEPQTIVVVILHALLTLNTVLDPMLYTLFDVIRRRMKKNELAENMTELNDMNDSTNTDTLTSVVRVNAPLLSSTSSGV